MYLVEFVYLVAVLLVYLVAVLLVYLAFTRMPGESYRRRLCSLLLDISSAS